MQSILSIGEIKSLTWCVLSVSLLYSSYYADLFFCGLRCYYTQFNSIPTFNAKVHRVSAPLIICCCYMLKPEKFCYLSYLMLHNRRIDAVSFAIYLIVYFMRCLEVLCLRMDHICWEEFIVVNLQSLLCLIVCLQVA